MNLYKVTDKSRDKKADPVVFVQAEDIGSAAKRAGWAMDSGRDVKRTRLVVEFICNLDQCYTT